MPQYQAIEEYLGVVTKLCGEKDEFLLYLISIAMMHCVERSQIDSRRHAIAS